MHRRVVRALDLVHDPALIAGGLEPADIARNFVLSGQ